MSPSGGAKAARRAAAAAAAAGAAASATVTSVVDALTGASDVPADDARQERTAGADEPSVPSAAPAEATTSAESSEAVEPAAETVRAEHAEHAEPTEHAEHPATTGYGTPASDACSVQWDHDGTSAYGTAATARFFVCVEQPGPWGRDAARESHLDRDLGAELDARTSRAGGRFMLVRRPGGHPAHDGPRHVLVAHAGARPDEAWLLTAEVDDVGDLLGLDWGALARGSQALVQASLLGSRPTAPTLLVCTNGRRDVCCAVRGRPLAAHAARVAPGRAWEVSHTGGHRFAPTAVLLPWGQTLARLDEPASEWVLAASESGHLPAELLGPLHDRGRSGVPGVSQCAESHVRAETGETRIAALWAGQPEASDEGSEVIVTHADGRRWRVGVTREPVGRTRPESCGKKAIEVMEHRASILEAWF
ncbi:sucrase ferredoxin [Terrabacter sp. C0L_2]|uniref:sucrase ferredoxin n=1 Tax=Terrabacter sp. C0L_2 TaxID=3108389 RepID=UPI002ED5F137|nr:sucrase ferredoxin [Terrabacter sp. C0L_2]